MRHTHYMRKVLETGEVTSLPFTADDYAIIGVGYSPAVGMPILEAYQLINKWNVNQLSQRYVYALANF